jgi:hypothetical protein
VGRCVKATACAAYPLVSVRVIRDWKVALWRDDSNMETLLAPVPPWEMEHIMHAPAESTPAS